MARWEILIRGWAFFFLLGFSSSLSSEELEGTWRVKGEAQGEKYQGVVELQRIGPAKYYLYGHLTTEAGKPFFSPLLGSEGAWTGEELILRRGKLWGQSIGRFKKKSPSRLEGKWSFRGRKGVEVWEKTIWSSPPRWVYLTFAYPDTSSHVVVNYHTRYSTRKSLVFYGFSPKGGDVSRYPFRAKGYSLALPRVPVRIHRVILKKLRPGRRYYFVCGDPQSGVSQVFSFQTLPTSPPFQFVVGGDMGVGKVTAALLTQAARKSPHFVALGGDIAYANGDLKNFPKWEHWLSLWQRYMKKPSRDLIPLMMAIGNHEVRSHFFGNKQRAPFYFGYFYQGGKSYFVRHLGKVAALFFLDTSHVAPFWGDQSQWLETALFHSQSFSFRFAVYHVPLYPSVRSFYSPFSLLGRLFWKPYFEQYRLTVAFEHHDHALKRTKPIGKRNKVIYLGDGAFGKGVRTPRRRRYLAFTAAKRHFWYVRLTKNKALFQAISPQGKVLDQFEISKP